MTEKPIHNETRVTVPSILSAKSNGQKIAALTAYDYTTARLIDNAGIDIILVGDTLGCIVQGHPNTLTVTLDEMVYHCRAVARAVKHALLVGDLPFMSYQLSPEQALQAAGRLLKEGAVSAVKLEGGINMAPTIRRLVDVDIPVMGHVGLTPQSYHRMGGYKVQGRSSSGSLSSTQLVPGSRERVLADAKAVEKAGAFAIVLEGLPADLAAEITRAVVVPTIGIGAGAGCDGQILVNSDLLGLDPDFKPRFVKHYANLARDIERAVQSYCEEVRAGIYPGPEHSFREKSH